MVGKTKEWGLASLIFGLVSAIPSYLVYRHQMSYEGRIEYLGNGQLIEYYPNYDVVNLMIMGMIVGFIFSIIGIIKIISAIGPQDRAANPDYWPVQNQAPVKSSSSSFCPYCGYDAGLGAIRCPRCTGVLNKVCPSCGERLPLEFNACPKCGVVFKQTIPESSSDQTEIIEHYFPPRDQQPIEEKKPVAPVKPIRGVAIGRCPTCNKILLKGWDKCQNCGWKIVVNNVHPIDD